MNQIFIFEVKTWLKRKSSVGLLILIVILGIAAGSKSRFTISADVYINAPYQIGFITGMLSLLSIFFSTIFVTGMLFREADSRFSGILFSLPLRKYSFFMGRYSSILLPGFLCMLLFIIAFFFGQYGFTRNGIKGPFEIMHFISPVLFFGLINTFFTTSVLCFIGRITGSKMLVYVGGLLLYILYMVSLLFSGSPFMAGSLPQSEWVQVVSAYTDPFGLSAFFYDTRSWTVEQRNTVTVPLHGIFVMNRLCVSVIAVFLLYAGTARKLNTTGNEKLKKKYVPDTIFPAISFPLKAAHTGFDMQARLKMLFSFVRSDTWFILRSPAFILTAMAVLFYTGMEMYAEIEKGIRLPQKYVTSDLMMNIILENFHGLCLIPVIYFLHEMIWRSRNNRFHLIEDSTAFPWIRQPSLWLSISLILFLLSLLVIVLGIFFQIAYGYRYVEWHSYLHVFLYGALPLMLASGFIIVLQSVMNHKYLGLGASSVAVFILATGTGKKLVSFPLLDFMRPLQVGYSAMNGFAPYDTYFICRMISGFTLITLISIWLFRKNLRKVPGLIPVLTGMALIVWLWTAWNIMDDYQPSDNGKETAALADYERKYRQYADLPGLTITDVQTEIDLYPAQNSYTIRGRYRLVNKSGSPVSKLLIGFPEGFNIHKAVFTSSREQIAVDKSIQETKLFNPVKPGDTASFEFELSYRWKAVNGYHPFNAIVANGSFMRIGRYYPTIGYRRDMEISDSLARIIYGLKPAPSVTEFDAPKAVAEDFIRLDMTISTPSGQRAIGIGELISEWSEKERNFFHYRTVDPVPFRFAVSSAGYAIKKQEYKGRSFEVYYHPAHQENVEHLLQQAKETMDYCESQFGPYPFHTIRFAEVSSFTRGFAATAYPATIFMTEQMVFHANIAADQQQDVISELAAHELSHHWWGGSQVSPDDRAGAAMLTETLAMYTELMLIKKIYGKEQLLKRVRMHLDIYHHEKGFSREEPLYKVLPEQAHISYSKGAVVMYLLSELIGEEKVNRALTRFLEKHRYPNPRPVSMDLLTEFYAVSDPVFHSRIDEYFKSITELSILP